MKSEEKECQSAEVMCLNPILDTLPISTHSYNACFQNCYVCTCRVLIESG